MKKILLLTAAMLTICASASAQYFSTTKGAQLIYKSTNFEDNSETQKKSTVLSVETAADGVIKTRVEDVQGDAENPLSEVKTFSEYSYNPQTDITLVTLMTADDFKGFIMSMLRQSVEASGQHMSEMEYADLEKNISSKGSIEFELNPKATPDTKLQKSSLRLSAGMMTMRANLWEGKIHGVESVTVPAGTYECIKVSYQMVISGQNGSDKRFLTDWYAKGVGVVKSVETDKKGNVKGEEILVAIK